MDVRTQDGAPFVHSFVLLLLLLLLRKYSVRVNFLLTNWQGKSNASLQLSGAKASTAHHQYFINLHCRRGGASDVVASRVLARVGVEKFLFQTVNSETVLNSNSEVVFDSDDIICLNS